MIAKEKPRDSTLPIGGAMRSRRQRREIQYNRDGARAAERIRGSRISNSLTSLEGRKAQ